MSRAANSWRNNEKTTPAQQAADRAAYLAAQPRIKVTPRCGCPRCGEAGAAAIARVVARDFPEVSAHADAA